MKQKITDILYSFPFQLLVLHLRSNLFVTFVWVVLFLIITGTVGEKFGIQYLFLAPEYLGRVGFGSFFILGLAFGGFVMTWNIITYLLDAYHFPFLASLSRPFRKYCINNAVLPLAFVLTLLGYHLAYETYYEYVSIGRALWECLAFLLGTIFTVVLIVTYLYWTNKDIFSFLKAPPQLPPDLQSGPQKRRIDVDDVFRREQDWRVDTYLTESLRPRIVRSVAHYDRKVLRQVFQQNHTNVLLLILIRIIFLVILGLFVDYAAVRIPTGASFFLLLTILISVIGALTFWFGRWRVVLAIVFLLCYNFITSHDLFNHRSQGYGMDYESAPAEYSVESLEAITAPEIVETDRQVTEEILETWLQKNQEQGIEKPKMVLFCVSGGGLKASLFTMKVLQEVNRATDRRFDRQTVLMSGASGGMVGSAYYRELLLRSRTGQPIDPADSIHLKRIGSDLLNSISFALVANDLFLPWVKFRVNDRSYTKDRGYMFERQLNENLAHVFDGKTIGAYRDAERRADIPLLFVTPSILNDGRRMLISPQGVSYMMAAPVSETRNDAVEIDAVDFGRLFAEQDADALLFTSALRFNATYPYILPTVTMPSEPQIELVDAGFRDNFGLKSATRFVHVFDDWIREHTSGVVLVQVRAYERNLKITDSGGQGDLDRLFDPLGIAGQVITLQDYEHDTSIGFLYNLLGEDFFEIVRFTYRPEQKGEEAPISFHLTEREKRDILRSMESPQNRTGLQRLRQLLGE